MNFIENWMHKCHTNNDYCLFPIFILRSLLFLLPASLPHSTRSSFHIHLTPFGFAAAALMMVLIFFQHYNSTSRDTLCTTKRLAGVFVIVISLYYYILCFVFLNFLLLSRCAQASAAAAAPPLTLSASFALALFSHSCHPMSERERCAHANMLIHFSFGNPIPICCVSVCECAIQCTYICPRYFLLCEFSACAHVVGTFSSI